MLSFGPTPHTPLADWIFTLRGAVDASIVWTWDQLPALPAETITTDIHCVTNWSKLDTSPSSTWHSLRRSSSIGGMASCSG